MKKYLPPILTISGALLLGTAVWAKLPSPADEAKAKAAEAAARTAWSGKVDGYQLCRAQDRVAAHVKKASLPDKDAKAAGKAGVKDAKPGAVTSTCVDPGPFVYPAAAPASASVPAKKS